jgi:phage-related protein
MSRTVKFYKTSSGKCPIKEFLDSLSGKAAQKVVWVLRLLEDLDIIPVTYFKKLIGTEYIWECRIQYGSHIYRVFCFFDSNATVVLTHGFRKKSMKTPRQEIERAESYKRDYFNRKRVIK